MRKTSSKSTDYFINSVFFFFLLHHLISQEAALTVINEQKLQTIYAKLKSREKIHSEQIQQFIRISIAFTHILKLTAWDLKAIQETTTAQIK